MAQKKTTANKPATKPSFVSQKAKSAPKKEKSPIVFSDKIGNIFSWICCVLFIGLAAFILIGRNSDMMYQAQNFSFFNSTELFFKECMTLPGGLITWIASYLTQHLYVAEVGGTILILLWGAIYFATKKALKVSSVWSAMMLIPIVSLLISEVDTGYWLYYIKQDGYWFYGTVGFLISMLMTWAAHISKSSIYRTVLVAVVGSTYYLFGWYSLLTMIYIAVLHLIDSKSAKVSVISRLIVPCVALILVAAIPFVSYNFYANARLEDMWLMGYPFFTADTELSIRPQIPFIVMAASPVLLAVLPKEKNLKGGIAVTGIVLNLAVMYACAHSALTLDFQDYNYHAEIRMYRAMENREWDKVLDEMSNLPGDANRQMVLFKNIALLNKGEMGTKMFKYNNKGNNPQNGFDSLKIHMVQTGAPLIYMNHAKTNFAIRWCIENGVEYGPSFNNIKILAQCSLVNKEMKVARKYLKLLQNTAYHREWAEHYLPLTEKPELLSEYHEFDVIRELHDHMGSVLDGDQGLCEMYLLNYFSNTMNKDSKLLEELTLNYAMVQKDIQLFWPRFFGYANMHKGEEMPIHYQEAAFLYGNLEHGVDISTMPFNKEKVVNRYAGFQQLSQSLLASGMNSQEVGEAMKASYGDTFYWFYFFCRDVHSY